MIALVLSAGLTACGGDGSGAAAPAPTYTIGGQVTMLTGAGLVLLNNGGNALPVSVPGGSFTFTTSLAGGAGYSVTVQTQPTGQTCSVSAGTGAGTVGSMNVSTVAVACTTNAVAMVWDTPAAVWDNTLWQ